MPFLALALWPMVSLALFARLGAMLGVIWAALLGALFLPEAFSIDLPGLPPLNKNTTIVLGLLLGLLVARQPGPGHPSATRSPTDPMGPVDPVVRNVLLAAGALFLLSVPITVLANSEGLVFGPTYRPALGLRDLIQMSFDASVFLVPYLLAMRYLATAPAQTALLKALLALGLVYSLLVLFEARMSPQLHVWTYGYFQHSWVQHIRGGGFRPIVFLQHGLWVGILMATCCMATFILLRENVRSGQKVVVLSLAGIWFFIVLLVSRNLGATLIAAVFVPMLWFFGSRLQLICATLVVSTFLVFPLLRQTEIVTMQGTISAISRLSEERAGSLAFRVEHEDAFLERASMKPLTGWGGWSRSRVHDPETGQDISVADGAWIIQLGQRGWIGYLGYFGLLGAPVLLLWRRRKQGPLPAQTAGLTMLMAATLVYQVPNATIGIMVTLIAGALAGHALRETAPAEGGQTQAPAEGHRTATAHTRFPAGSAGRDPSAGPSHRPTAPGARPHLPERRSFPT